jgi:hypothetical protein
MQSLDAEGVELRAIPYYLPLLKCESSYKRNSKEKLKVLF